MVNITNKMIYEELQTLKKDVRKELKVIPVLKYVCFLSFSLSTFTFALVLKSFGVY